MKQEVVQKRKTVRDGPGVSCKRKPADVDEGGGSWLSGAVLFFPRCFVVSLSRSVGSLVVQGSQQEVPCSFASQNGGDGKKDFFLFFLGGLISFWSLLFFFVRLASSGC